MPYVEEDIEQSIKLMLSYAQKAEARAAQLVCFPECYLQGYVVSERSADLAIDLSSIGFQTILSQFKPLKPIIVFGLIEREGKNIFNTAAVIKKGQLLGRYRKHKLVGTENDFFKAGNDFPIFELEDIKFGINICYDLNFSDCARAVSEQGAQLLVCPSNNMMRFETAEKWKGKHNLSRAERAKETKLHLVSADVTGKHKNKVSYGPTAVINPQGKVITQVPLMTEGLITQDIQF